MIQFDPTITLGAVLQTLSVFGTVVGGAIWLSRRLMRMEMKINIMWSWWTRRMKIDDTDKEIMSFFDPEKVNRSS